MLLSEWQFEGGPVACIGASSRAFEPAGDDPLLHPRLTRLILYKNSEECTPRVGGRDLFEEVERDLAKVLEPKWPRRAHVVQTVAKGPSVL